MALLPPKNSTQEFDQSAQTVLCELRKGSAEKRNEFV